MKGVVFSGHEDKTGNIFVETMLAESGYLNEKNAGFTAELLTKWHNEKAWEGKVHNAHPSKNHPLVYAQPPVDKSPLGQISHYLSESAKWSFATYIKTKLYDIANGQKRLNGIMRITEEPAKRAWREGKFPKYTSCSIYATKIDDATGLISDAVPISSTSVDSPAFPVNVAGIYNQCEGGDECVTKLVENSEDCNYCRYQVLTNFKHVFSSQIDKKVLENAMSSNTEQNSSTASSSDTGTPINKISEEHTSADGKKTEVIQEPVDWESKAKDLEAKLKDSEKKNKDYEKAETANNERFLKLEKEKLESKVRSVIEKIPLAVFDEKEENREEAVKKYIKMYPKMTEEEIMDIVNDRFLIAAKVSTPSNQPSAKKGLKESGITVDAPAKASAGNKGDVSILELRSVFG